jgi:hypothetical protein
MTRRPAWPVGQEGAGALTVMAVDADACSWCGGRGWKFLGLRRDPANAGDAGERAVLRRPRVACLACGGTGSAQPGDQP